MGKISAKCQTRRPVQYWSCFNAWWRAVLDDTGRRPEASAINKWYDENAEGTWAPHEMPTVLETRVHAKCLRSVDEVRNYFRAYRAQRRADAVNGRDGGRDGGGDDGDMDVAPPRGAPRRPGATGKTSTHKGGVAKVVTSSGRTVKPNASRGGAAGTDVDYTEDGGAGAGDDSTWQPYSQDQTHLDQAPYQQHQQLLQPHLRQQSAGSGAAGGSSIAFGGGRRQGPSGLQTYHQQQGRYRGGSHTQPASPAEVGAVDGKEGQPDVEVGDLTYDDLEAPCSSVSTASLDDLLGLHDGTDAALHDDAAFCAAAGVGVTAAGSARGAGGGPMFSGSGGDSHGRGAGQLGRHPQHMGPGGPGADRGGAPQGLQQHHHQQHGHHGQRLSSSQHQHHKQLLQQQPGSAGGSDLRSIFDDCDPSLDPIIHAQLRLLPAKHEFLQPHVLHNIPYSNQQQQQERYPHEQQPYGQQQQGQQQEGVRGCKEAQQACGKGGNTVWSPLLSARPMPYHASSNDQQQAQQHTQQQQQHSYYASGQTHPQALHPSYGQHLQQHPSHLPPVPCGWPLPTLEQQQAQQQAQQLHTQQQAQQQKLRIDCYGTQRSSYEGTCATAATPMEGVACQEGPSTNWHQPLPQALLKHDASANGCGGSSGAQIQRHQQNHQQSYYSGARLHSGSSTAGPSPEAPSSLPPVSLKYEPIEPPQPSQPHSLWLSESCNDADMELGGMAASPPPQPPHNTPTWLGPHVQPPVCSHGATVIGSAADLVQQRLLQLQGRVGGGALGGPSHMSAPAASCGGNGTVSGSRVGELSGAGRAPPPMPAAPHLPVPALPPLPPFPPRHQQQQQQQNVYMSQQQQQHQAQQPHSHHQRSSSLNSCQLPPTWGGQQQQQPPLQPSRPHSSSSSSNSWPSAPAPTGGHNPLPVPLPTQHTAPAALLSVGAVRVASWSHTAETCQDNPSQNFRAPFDVTMLSQQLRLPSGQVPAFPLTLSCLAPSAAAGSCTQQAPATGAAPAAGSPARARRHSQPSLDMHSRLAFLQQHRHVMQEEQHQPLPSSTSMPCALHDPGMGGMCKEGSTGSTAAERHIVTTGSNNSGSGTRPTLMRTLSAPAGDGGTPGAAAAAAGPFADPAGPYQQQLAPLQPGVTPRNQMLQHGGGGGASGGFGTPGLGMASPPGWGDSALADLEGDSAWLRSMLAPDMTPPMSLY